jgi:hypothetical protein
VTIFATDGTATFGNDYILPPIPVIFRAGANLDSNPTQDVQFTIRNDQVAEGQESFTLYLGVITAPGDTINLGAISSIVVTITDDDGAAAP